MSAGRDWPAGRDWGGLGSLEGCWAMVLADRDANRLNGGRVVDQWRQLVWTGWRAETQADGQNRGSPGAVGQRRLLVGAGQAETGAGGRNWIHGHGELTQSQG